MMCPSCKEDIPDYSVFCLYCGTWTKATGEGEERIEFPQVDSKIFSHQLRADLLHDFKNTLGEIQTRLDSAMEANTARKHHTLYDLSRWISLKINEIHEILAARVAEKPVSINEEIQAIVKYFSVSNSRRKVAFKCVLDETIPPVKIVEAEVREVLVAVISNAVRAVQERVHPEITISSNIMNINNIKFIQVIVMDNGMGIPSSHKDHIFEQGYTTYPGATGLGLYIARSILKSYGGDLYYESENGHDTSFYIQFPPRRLAA